MFSLLRGCFPWWLHHYTFPPASILLPWDPPREMLLKPKSGHITLSKLLQDFLSNSETSPKRSHQSPTLHASRIVAGTTSCPPYPFSPPRYPFLLAHGWSAENYTSQPPLQPEAVLITRGLASHSRSHSLSCFPPSTLEQCLAQEVLNKHG